MYFKKLGDLNNTKGKFASYNDDRIVFYEDNNTGKDFVAYVGFNSLSCASLFFVLTFPSTTRFSLFVSQISQIYTRYQTHLTRALYPAFEGSTKTLGITAANTVIIDNVAWA